MLINHTEEFLKLRKSNFNPVTIEIITLKRIKEQIKLIDIHFGQLSALINSKDLPIIGNTQKINDEIEEEKNIIVKYIKDARQMIFEICMNLGEDKLKKLFSEHYSNLIEDFILKFEEKNIKILQKISNNSSKSLFYQTIPECIEENIEKTYPENYNSSVILTKKLKEDEINYQPIITSLTDINSMMLELKIEIKSQRRKINTLDEYFDKSNKFAKNANDEIKKISRGVYIKIQNKIIYVQISVIIIQSIALIYKRFNK